MKAPAMVTLIVGGRVVAQIAAVYPSCEIRTPCSAASARAEMRQGNSLLRAWTIGQIAVGDMVLLKTGAAPGDLVGQP